MHLNDNDVALKNEWIKYPAGDRTPGAWRSRKLGSL